MVRAPRFGILFKIAACQAALIFLLSTAVTAAANEASQAPGKGPAPLITDFHGTLIETMKRFGANQPNSRRNLLTKAVDQTFHLGLTAEKAAGRKAWNSADPNLRQTYLAAFRLWTVGNYLDQFRAHGGERFETTGEKPGPRAGVVLVESRLIPGNGSEPVTFTYVMVRNDKRWGVYDVLVKRGTTSISQLARQRSEFRATARRGLQSLTDLLLQKTGILLKDSRP